MIAKSHSSYFIQLADWNAFACHRSRYVDPKPNVDEDLWDALGERLLLPVDQNSLAVLPESSFILRSP